MKKRGFKPISKIFILLMIPLYFSGCSGTLEQHSQTVRVSPVSDEYRLTERIEGKTYILLAETSTGQEQHRSEVSDSLARALKKVNEKNDVNVNDEHSLNFSLFGLSNKEDIRHLANDRLEVLSFTDLTNKLNEKGICQRHAEMRKFYQENGMFRKSDLEFLAQEIDADYLVLPCLLDIKRWSQSRLSVVGVKCLQTQIVSGILSMEIWDTKSGRKVFSATSDVTLANERIREKPIAMEEAFESAWLGIMQELPGYPVTDQEQIYCENDDSVTTASSYVKAGENREYEIKQQRKSQDSI